MNARTDSGIERNLEVDFLRATETGISSGPLLRGIEMTGSTAITHSVLMRARSESVRFVETRHNLQKKTIHWRSKEAEKRL